VVGHGGLFYCPVWESPSNKANLVLLFVGKRLLGDAVMKGPENHQEDLTETPVIRSYDFRKPNKFSKEQMSTFQVIYGSYARSLGTFLSVSLRGACQVSVLSIEQVTYEEFIHSLSDPSISMIFNMNPLEGTAVLELSTDLSFAMLERLMGWRGDRPVKHHRALTEIELTLMKNLGQKMLDLSKEAWENIISISSRMERIEMNPQFVQVVSPSEIVLLISIEVQFGNTAGIIQFCFPYLVLEPILDKFSAKYWFETTAMEKGINYREELKKKIESVNLQLCAVLGDTSITVRELTQLQVGDVVMLNKRQGEALDVLVGGCTEI
jgi:flagellar motor switch protein FliM